MTPNQGRDVERSARQQRAEPRSVVFGRYKGFRWQDRVRKPSPEEIALMNEVADEIPAILGVQRHPTREFFYVFVAAGVDVDYWTSLWGRTFESRVKETGRPQLVDSRGNIKPIIRWFSKVRGLTVQLDAAVLELDLDDETMVSEMEGELPQVQYGSENSSVDDVVAWIRTQVQFGALDAEYSPAVRAQIEDASAGIAEESRERLQSLAEVALLTIEIDLKRQRLDSAVRAARDHGATWAQIGTAAGITMQSAHRRWDSKTRAARTTEPGSG